MKARSLTRATLPKAAAVLWREGLAGLVHRARLAPDPGRVPDGFADDGQDFRAWVNEVIPRRAQVLGSDWHIGLIRSRTAVPDVAALPRITLSLVTERAGRILPGLLAGLQSGDYPADRVEVIAVQTAATSPGPVAEAAGAAVVRVLHRPGASFGRGQDEALASARTDMVLVTDGSVVFPRDAILRMVLAAQADAAQVAAWEPVHTPREQPRAHDPVTLETPCSSQSALLLRRAAVLAAGGIGDAPSRSFVDVDLSFRLRDAGHLLRVLPWVQVAQVPDAPAPDTLADTLAAAVLLRQRHGTPASAAAAEARLANLARSRGAAGREAEAALGLIARYRSQAAAHRPRGRAVFPFHGLALGMPRVGADRAPAPIPAAPPTVSVVTRTHGPRLDLLGEAICTVLNQSWPATEHVIVEDRGDHARDLVQRTAAAYGRDLRHMTSPGAGRSAVGNAGLAAARGSILVLLDNDDLLFPDHLATLAAPLAADPRLNAVYALAWEVESAPGTDGAAYAEGMPVLHPTLRLPFSRRRLRHMNFIPIQSVAFRKELFTRAGGFDEDLDALEDWALWGKYLRFGDFRLIARVTSIYHIPADPGARTARQQMLRAAHAKVRSRIRRGG